MTNENTRIRIQIYNKGGKVADIKGENIPKELKHARQIYYSKIGVGGD